MISVAPGVPFEVQLPAPAGAGYEWQLAAPPEGVQLRAASRAAPAGAQPGDGSTQVFELQTTKAGRFRLTFELKRRWESEPIEKRTIEVEAK
jgi:predicted secreted protein